MRIGLISDTHGRLDPAIWEVFDGVDAILHAGDWGEYSLAAVLSSIAPVQSVRGNVDPPTRRFPDRLTTEIGGVSIYLTHMFDTSPASLNAFTNRNPDIGLVLFGHTHSAFVERVAGTVFVNPGSATRPRGGPPSAAIATIED
ncbi:MAG TPA: metallophosphoesterase, partial [Firmicutes bacterium]|nr:metallophosphoesterase [Bacillota bacterium]